MKYVSVEIDDKEALPELGRFARATVIRCAACTRYALFKAGGFSKGWRFVSGTGFLCPQHTEWKGIGASPLPSHLWYKEQTLGTWPDPGKAATPDKPRVAYVIDMYPHQTDWDKEFRFEQDCDSVDEACRKAAWAMDHGCTMNDGEGHCVFYPAHQILKIMVKGGNVETSNPCRTLV